MVVVSASAANRTNSKTLSLQADPTPRPPLIPSEKDNAVISRRTAVNKIASRYLSYTAAPAATNLRRHPSPSPLLAPSTFHSDRRRSNSVGRLRPDSASAHTTITTPTISTTTRSLSVSFQGESFFYQTSRTPKPSSPKTALDRRIPFTPKPSIAFNPEKLRPVDRWPAARSRLSNPLARSLDCSDYKKSPIIATIRLMPRSMVFDDGGIDRDPSTSSDTDSASSGSNSGVPETIAATPRLPRGISVPARFLQRPLSPRSDCSPLRRIVPPLSQSKLVATRPGNAPSIIRFAAEVRRAKKGESRIEEAHMLRLFHNRQLQWRFVNAKASTSANAQRQAVEKNLFNAWKEISGMRDSVTLKSGNLHLQTQNLKLTSILKEHLAYLEEWSVMDRDHLSSMSGVIEALKASTLRLPVVGGARADLQEVKDAVGSAVEVMQAMGSSICSLLSKVEETTPLVSELAKVAAQERNLLDQSRELLSTVAAMNVTHCSLRGQILQLKHRRSEMLL